MSERSPNPDSSCGILYIATDDTYLEEARQSAERVSQLMDVPIAAITHREIDDKIFDQVLVDRNPTESFAEKPRNFLRSPFDKTLYLDTDTYLTDSVLELFDILNEYDIAVAPSLSSELVSQVPPPRTQYNTGVVSYRSKKSVQEFLTLWQDIYKQWHEERDVVEDQPSFLKAVYESDINLFTLSINYNARLFSPGALHGEAKIVHGRPETGIENAARLINESSRFRTFYRNSYFSQSSAFKIVEDASPRYHLEKAISERGIKRTLLDAPQYIKDRIL